MLTSVDLPAPFGPIRPTTSRCRSSSETSRSARTPANERETAEARSDPPGLRGVSVCETAVKCYESGLFGTTFAVMVPFAIGTLLLISTTRYWRPKTECSFFEKLTLPENVGTL
jgi:hypothetical protein